MMKPGCTVLIDTYNHERFIEEAIVSALEQDFPRSAMEILVVDDGSTDRTPEIARKFEPHLRLLRKANGGQASAFNAGIPEARGEIIAFLDGDDWWAPNKLTRVVETLAADPSVGVVGHGIIQVYTAEKRCSTLSPGKSCRFDLLSIDDAQMFRNYMCFLGTSRVAIRREAALAALPIPESLVVEADEFMSAVSIAHGAAMVLNDCLTYYRLHGQNLYQFQRKDPARSRTKLNSLASLAEALPGRLKAAGIAPEAIDVIVDPVRVMALRARLALDGGMPWSTYQVEREDMRLSYRKTSLAYRIYKELSLLLALTLPPRRFYQLREWYAVNGLRNLRRILGEPEPVASLVEQLLEPGAETGERERSHGVHET
jgi:glycosyltransferase involved in cell wall biosynthesis